MEGDISHPSNFGKLCIKGGNLADTLGLETRVLEPMIVGRKASRQAASWDTAISGIADKFQQCIDQHGRGGIAFMFQASC